jgi:hypothetical protein
LTPTTKGTKKQAGDRMTELQSNDSNPTPHGRHPEAPVPHLRDLSEELPNWWTMTQTPIQGLRKVSVAEIVGSASGCGWQFDADWIPRSMVVDYRFWQVFDSIDERGFDPDFDGSHIELILFKDEYWVADGHRRVSVAAILGIRNITAEITLLTPTSSS